MILISLCGQVTLPNEIISFPTFMIFSSKPSGPPIKNTKSLPSKELFEMICETSTELIFSPLPSRNTFKLSCLICWEIIFASSFCLSLIDDFFETGSSLISRFLIPRSIRIGMTKDYDSIEAVAFKRPDDLIAVIILNRYKLTITKNMYQF